MYYPFICINEKCKNYNHIVKIDMPMKDYVGTGHMCKECGTEMVREVKSLVCGCSVDKTGDFYRSVN